MNGTADRLFEYLKNVMYDPAKAVLDVDQLDPDFQALGKGLVYFAQCVEEVRSFSTALAKGDLSTPTPSRHNEMAAPLKALQASLRHMTWQSQQVAKGDYQQHVEFLGEFAEAFNTMTHQLDQRQRALEREIESSQKKTLALEQSNLLFEAVTAETSLWIFVVARDTGARLFINRAAADMLTEYPDYERQLRALLEEDRRQNRPVDKELEIRRDGQVRYVMAKGYPMEWRQKEAMAYVFRDVTERHRLEDAAYQDSLTGVHNRHYGMMTLRRWLEEDRAFCLCMVDMDNLKYVNDTYGHGEGDNYILYVTRTMRQVGLESEVCRLGGDEFLLLTPLKDCAAVAAELEKVRRALIEGSFVQGEPPYLRSISYGLVEVEPGNTLDASELLGLADERMYEYKRAHRMERRSLTE